jgi:XRE family transcriptional regulator, regulator of sulfur utilization
MEDAVAARKQDVENGAKKDGATARAPRSRSKDGAGSKDEPEAEPRPSRDRPLAGPGDDVGAAELGRRVADHLRERRKARGMSLDDLARSSGVSRAALSQVETCKSNPTVGLLWKIAVGLGVPFSELIGERRTGATVLRRGDAQILRSLDGKLESRPLSPAGSSPLVELYELRLAARSTHASEAHAPGTRELLVVLTGSVRLRVGEEAYELGPGDSIGFAADRPHAYENPGSSDARYHNVILYER